jgi:hypothetical protein
MLFNALAIVQLAAMAVTVALVWRMRAEPSRRAIVIAGLIWVAFATVFYWIAGPNSFALINQELDYGVTQQAFFAGLPQGTRFAHGFAGGNDIHGMSAISGSLVSLDRLLLDHLPLWLAFTVNRVLATGLGLLGGYLICRRWGGCDRLTAFAASALATVAGEFTTTVVWSVGLGYAILPLVVYAVVLRLGRPGYWWGVGAVSVLNALSCTPSHSMVATCATLGFAALLLGPRGTLRALPGMAMVVVAVILVWHETLFAMALIGPWSYRASLGVKTLTLGEAVARVIGMTVTYKEITAVLVLALLLLWRGAPRAALWPGLLTVALLAGPVALFQVPWRELGLGPLGAFNFGYLLYGLPVVACLLMGLAGTQWRGRAPLAGIVLAALAVGRLAWLDAYQPVVWLSQGGLKIIATGELAHAAWRPAEPTRVVSVPYRLPTNTAATAGLDSFDGFTALVPRPIGVWWGRAIPWQEASPDAGNLTMEPQLDLKCCARTDMARLINLDALRIANVGIILSRLPLGGDGLRLLSDTDDSVAPPRTGAPLAETLRTYAGYLSNPPSLHAYGIGVPLPRVYSPTGLHVVADDIGDGELVKEVLARALDRVVVIRRSDAAGLGGYSSGVARIVSFAPVLNGFDVEMEAPTGGLVVINAPWMPFWRATVDGAPIPVVAGNVIHMAAAVAPGARQLRLRWERPLLREKLLN